MFLVLLWSGLCWVFLHQRGIRRELIKDEAMPKPGPRTNFLVLVGAVVTGLSGLMLYLIFG